MRKRNFKSKLKFALVVMLCVFVHGECYGETKTYVLTFGKDGNCSVPDIGTNSYTESKGVWTIKDSLMANGDESVKWMMETDVSVPVGKSPYTEDNNNFRIGSGSCEVSYIKFSTPDIPGRIKSVAVKAEISEKASTTYLEVSVGGNSMERKKIAIYNSSDRTSTVTCFDKGEVVINICRDKAETQYIRIYSITIVYNDAKEYTLDETSTANTIEKSDSVIFDLKRNFSSSYWNTVCLPFSLTADEIATAFGEGTVVKEFTGVTGTTMNFTTADSITAGVPYLMKPANDVAEHFFEDVSITETEPQTVSHGGYSFVGIFNATSLCPTDVFIGTDGKLHNPAEGSAALKGTRAYIKLPAGESASAAKLSLGDITGITSTISSKAESGQIYNINGQTISKPTKGLYIRNGKKYIMK